MAASSVPLIKIDRVTSKKRCMSLERGRLDELIAELIEKVKKAHTSPYEKSVENRY